MATAFTCPHCQKQMQVEDHLAGQQVSCPSCSQTLTAPGSPPTAPPGTLHATTLRERRAGLAIASLVLGIVGFCTVGIAGIVGVILGIVALVKAANEPQVDRGRGFAIAGIVTGAVSLLMILPLMVAILLPSLSRARELAKRSVCGANLRSVEISLRTYVDDYAQEPPSLSALVDENRIGPAMLKCPSADPVTGQAISYLWVGGVDCTNGENVVMYEPLQNHGGEGGNVLFCDGHVEFVPQTEWEQVLGDGGVNLP
ncbi:MAG: DUF4190 domain-containing protein [Planctomycetes bacterium]|nr:DUF4190 domain-containing protein [Planctomycetota bacterium]